MTSDGPSDPPATGPAAPEEDRPAAPAVERPAAPAVERPAAPAVVKGEVREALAARERRRRLFPRAALVGLLAGTLGVAFRLGLVAVEGLREALARYALAHPFPWLAAPVLWGAAGAAAAVWLVRRLAPEAVGSGIPHLKAVLGRLRPFPWRRIIPVKFLGGILAIGGGLALGREGPTVQMGGGVGAGLARVFHSSPGERLALIAAGAGAGLAAAFNAPLAGVVFVLEEVQRDFAPPVFASALIASAVADVVSRAATGQYPVFRLPAYPAPELGSLPAFAVLGVLAGLLGVAFNQGLLFTLDAFARSRWSGARLAAGVGALVGVVGLLVPGTIGGGQGIVQDAFAGRIALAAIPALILLRLALTFASYSVGSPGGIFAPLLVLGALLGAGTGEVARHALPGAVPAAYAVVGMAAVFTAIVRAPLTGVVLIIEMTGNYGQMLALLVACFAAYAVAEGLGDRPIYEALLQRDLLRGGGGEAPELGGTLVLEFGVEPGAPFAGRPVRELGLPSGCVLVTRHRGLAESVVTAGTTFQPGDRGIAVIAPEAAASVVQLREGFGQAEARVDEDPD